MYTLQTAVAKEDQEVTRQSTTVLQPSSTKTCGLTLTTTVITTATYTSISSTTTTIYSTHTVFHTLTLSPTTTSLPNCDTMTESTMGSEHLPTIQTVVVKDYQILVIVIPVVAAILLIVICIIAVGMFICVYSHGNGGRWRYMV